MRADLSSTVHTTKPSSVESDAPGAAMQIEMQIDPKELINREYHEQKAIVSNKQHRLYSPLLVERELVAWRLTREKLRNNAEVVAHMNEIDPFGIHFFHTPTAEEMATLENEERLFEIATVFGFLDESVSEELYDEFISLPIGLLEKLFDAYNTRPTTDAQKRAHALASLYTAKNLLAIDEKRGTSEKHGDCGVERLKYAKAIFAMYGVPAAWFDKVIVDKGTFKVIFGNYPTEEGYLDDDGTPKDVTMMLVAFWIAYAKTSPKELEEERTRDDKPEPAKKKAKKGKSPPPPLTIVNLYDTFGAPLFVHDPTGKKLGALNISQRAAGKLRPGLNTPNPQ